MAARQQRSSSLRAAQRSAPCAWRCGCSPCGSRSARRWQGCHRRLRSGRQGLGDRAARAPLLPPSEHADSSRPWTVQRRRPTVLDWRCPRCRCGAAGTYPNSITAHACTAAPRVHTALHRPPAASKTFAAPSAACCLAACRWAPQAGAAARAPLPAAPLVARRAARGRVRLAAARQRPAGRSLAWRRVWQREHQQWGAQARPAWRRQPHVGRLQRCA